MPSLAIAYEAFPQLDEEVGEVAEEEVEQMVGMWDDIFAEVQRRHSHCDRQMAKQYLRCNDLAAIDVRFLFKAGDKILLKQRLVGKLQAKATGPYIFIKYTGRRRGKAIIGQAGGA